MECLRIVIVGSILSYTKCHLVIRSTVGQKTQRRLMVIVSIGGIGGAPARANTQDTHVLARHVRRGRLRDKKKANFNSMILPTLILII